MPMILFIAVGVALLLVVGLLLRGGAGAQSRPRRALRAGEMQPPGMPPRELMERIFAEDDLVFVEAEDAHFIRKQFLNDRRRMALCWLRQIRLEAKRILQLHLQMVRTDRALRPAAELKLIGHTLLFIAVYLVLVNLVEIYGAFGARAVLRNACALAGRLSVLGGSILNDALLPPLPVPQASL